MKSKTRSKNKHFGRPLITWMPPTLKCFLEMYRILSKCSLSNSKASNSLQISNQSSNKDQTTSLGMVPYWPNWDKTRSLSQARWVFSSQDWPCCNHKPTRALNLSTPPKFRPSPSLWTQQSTKFFRTKTRFSLRMPGRKVNLLMMLQQRQPRSQSPSTTSSILLASLRLNRRPLRITPAAPNR